MDKSEEEFEGRVSTGVTCIVVAPSGEMLLQLRDDCRGGIFPYPHMWCFPGGGKDDNDADFYETSARELNEEFGIRINKSRFEPVMNYAHDDITEDHVFICHVTLDEARLVKLGEGDGFAWVRMNGIKKLSLAWGQSEIIPAIEAYLQISASHGQE